MNNESQPPSSIILYQTEATIRNYRIVRLEGSREVAREIEHYSLPVILAIGYRVRSHRGTQSRQWHHRKDRLTTERQRVQ